MNKLINKMVMNASYGKDREKRVARKHDVFKLLDHDSLESMFALQVRFQKRLNQCPKTVEEKNRINTLRKKYTCPLCKSVIHTSSLHPMEAYCYECKQIISANDLDN